MRTLTPEHQRAAAYARHDPRAYARSIVAKWPDLDVETRAEIRGILSPVVNRPARKSKGGRSDA